MPTNEEKALNIKANQQASMSKSAPTQQEMWETILLKRGWHKGTTKYRIMGSGWQPPDVTEGMIQDNLPPLTLDNLFKLILLPLLDTQQHLYYEILQKWHYELMAYQREPIEDLLIICFKYLCN